MPSATCLLLVTLAFCVSRYLVDNGAAAEVLPRTATQAPNSISSFVESRLADVKPMTDRSNSTEPIPCTCGVFMSAQVSRGQQPKGPPVLSHEFDWYSEKTPWGNKQCINKCLDMIVSHLSSDGAVILCEVLGRDCEKEKAYLYIKNQDNQWLPSNLSGGREYCCKNGKPYKCPVTFPWSRRGKI